MTIKADVCIVGAGPSGLSLAYCLMKRRISLVLVERGEIGHSWSKQYPSLRLNSHRSFSRLPGLAIPRDYGEYISASQFALYLKNYADLLHIPVEAGFGVNALKRRREGWLVEGSAANVSARVVVLATGLFTNPIMPKFAGSFAGRIMHSCEYRGVVAMKQSRVLVVGSGSSAADIASDIGQSGIPVGLSIRGGVNIVRRLRSRLALWVAHQLLMHESIYRIAGGLWRRRIAVRGGGVLPVHPSAMNDPSYKPIVGGERLVHLVSAGVIAVHPGISHFDGTVVYFMDGSECEYDSIVCCTGYAPALAPFRDYEIRDTSGKVILDGLVSEPSLHSVGFDHLSAPRMGFLATIAHYAQRAAVNVLASLGHR